MVAVAVNARGREQGGEPVEEIERGEPDHGAAVGCGPRQVIDDLALGLSIPPFEPLQSEGWPGTVAEQPLEAGPVVRGDAN